MRSLAVRSPDTQQGSEAALGSTRAPAQAPPIVHEALRSPSALLDPGVRSLMEARLGTDLGRVRVHTDERAAASARAVQAIAYTVGTSIVFDRGRYAPHQAEGRRLLAHELVHTVQHGRSGSSPVAGPLSVDAAGSAAEHEATRIATGAGRGAPREPVRSAFSGGRVLSRTPGDPPRPPSNAPLTPQEMWEMVLDKRGLENRVPPHAVEAADAKAKAAQQRLAAEQQKLKEARDARRAHPDPEDKAMRGDVKDARRARDAAKSESKQADRVAQSRTRNRSEPVADVHEPLANTGPTVNKQQLGHGTKTYGAIQVTDEGGHSVAFGIGSFEGEMHAEEHALVQIRGQLRARGIEPGTGPRPGWKVTIVVDQVVCGETCRPALAKFAKEYEIAPGQVVAYYPQRVAPSKAATPKTTSKTAHYEPSHIPPGPGEPVLLVPEPPKPGGGGAVTPPPAGTPSGGTSSPDATPRAKVAVQQHETPVAKQRAVTADDARAAPAKPPAPPAQADPPSMKGSLTRERVTVEYDFTAGDKPDAVRLTRIDLSDYPPDRPTRVVRFFNDHPIVGQLTSVSANAAAGQLSSKLLDEVQSHFASAVEEAADELETAYPDTEDVLFDFDLDEYEQTFSAVAAWLEETDDLAQGLPGVEANLDAAFAYVARLEGLQEHLSQWQHELDAIHDDIERRAQILFAIARDVESAFTWMHAHLVGALLPVYYESFTLWSVRNTFWDLGSAVSGLAAHASRRQAAYRDLYDALDKRLDRAIAKLRPWRALYLHNRHLLK
jgi:hypothetical protein